jgi:ubiquinone/menaquinone biosynthesis C-methylase UbiE
MCFKRLQSIMTYEHTFKIDKDTFRENLTKYTRKAFYMLPPLDKPHILDIGCGSGVPTLELAQLCNGHVTGVDINQSLLDILTKRIKKAGLSHRVHALKYSLLELDFPNESFDILWSEGSIYVIGFKKGLVEWKKLIKPRKFLVVHDEIKNFTEKYKQIPASGYDLIDHFTISGDTWWKEYYNPLEKHINELRMKYSDNPAVLSACDTEQQEIDMFKKNPGQYGSVYFIMQKK